MTIYILMAIVYLIVGNGVYSMTLTISICAGLPEVRGMKPFTIIFWPLFVLYMGMK